MSRTVKIETESIDQLKKMMQMGYALLGEDFQQTLAYIQIRRKLEDKGFFEFVENWWKNNTSEESIRE